MLALTVAGSILALLVGFYTLTGINPLAEVFGGKAPGEAGPSTTMPVGGGADDPPEPPGPKDDPPEPRDPNDDPPAFSLTSSDWNGPCHNGCSMTAIFHNSGGMSGSATATFYVIRPSTGRYLAKCSVVIPDTGHNDKTSTGCTANSGTLEQYFQTYENVNMDISVDNP